MVWFLNGQCQLKLYFLFVIIPFIFRSTSLHLAALCHLQKRIKMRVLVNRDLIIAFYKNLGVSVSTLSSLMVSFSVESWVVDRFAVLGNNASVSFLVINILYFVDDVHSL